MNKKFNIILLFFIFLTSSYGLESKLSGFTTINGTISDQNYTYSKYINNDGTFRKNTKFGLQLDTQINNQFSLTAQGLYAQSLKNDDNFDLTLNWGFLSYRPTNDLLFRAGKIRAPFYLYSQSHDVGVTYDFETLPSEVYGLSPYDNGFGAIASKNFELENGTLTFDLFTYKMDLDARTYVPNYGAIFGNYKLDLYGLNTNYLTDDENTYRIGFYRTKLLGYDLSLVSLGFDYKINDDYKIVSEYIASLIDNYGQTFDGQGAYVALFRDFGDYSTYAKTGASWPTRTGIKSYSIGTAYNLAALQKIKFEFTHVDTGSNPKSLIDIVGDVNSYSKENINVFSLSYNFAF